MPNNAKSAAGHCGYVKITRIDLGTRIFPQRKLAIVVELERPARLVILATMTTHRNCRTDI